MTKKPDLYQTKDGSSTLYSNQFNQYYHNPNGAATESLHVFFKTSGLLDFLNSADSLTILEIGFGTGLNFLLLLDEYKKNGLEIPVNYISVEAFPISSQTAEQFHFEDHLKHRQLAACIPEIFANLSPGLNEIHPIKELNVNLSLFYGLFEDFNMPSLKADFIFHDAFSPEVNEKLWTLHAFEKLLKHSGNSAVLATYCAASKARAAMAAAGWFAARAPGALGKREMTLASSDQNKLAGFKRVNEKRLIQRLQNGDFD